MSFYILDFENNYKISKIRVQNSIDIQELLEKSWLQEIEKNKKNRISSSSSNNNSLTDSVTWHNIENMMEG